MRLNASTVACQMLKATYRKGLRHGRLARLRRWVRQRLRGWYSASKRGRVSGQ